MDFVRFPHTPHLAWFGEGQPRDDKVLTTSEARAFLAHEVLVEEKVDGANVGLSVDKAGDLRIQNRGTFLSREHCHPQFKPIFRWIEPRRNAIVEALGFDLIVFGEWCYATHSVRYTMLPDWFIAFDVYNRIHAEFWDSARRNRLVQDLDLKAVPKLGAGRFDMAALRGMLTKSRFSDTPAEGIYLRREESGRLLARAKIVCADFLAGIHEHWSRRGLVRNMLIQGARWR